VQWAVSHQNVLPTATRCSRVSTRIGHALSIERPVRHPLSSFVTALRRGWCHSANLLFLAHISPAKMVTLAWRKTGISRRQVRQCRDRLDLPCCQWLGLPCSTPCQCCTSSRPCSDYLLRCEHFLRTTALPPRYCCVTPGEQARTTAAPFAFQSGNRMWNITERRIFQRLNTHFTMNDPVQRTIVLPKLLSLA
jgi:hypothetical protein